MEFHLEIPLEVKFVTCASVHWQCISSSRSWSEAPELQGREGGSGLLKGRAHTDSDYNECW